MKATGIVRKVDQLGRIVLPKELRRMLDIKDRDEVEIYMQEDMIILKKYEQGCVLCGSMEKGLIVNDKKVCSRCVKAIAATPGLNERIGLE